MRQITRLGLAALLTTLAVQAADAQYYDVPPRGYDERPAYDERPVYPRRRERPVPARPVGLNCDAVQQGLTGPQPYSCPLPGPRPLGARCFCDMPIASFSQPQTAVGRVVP
ncbi:hypothetical protein FV232_12975 [Methylobacterium sp. WL30]|uniref:hypothetical protein n=1 Tax=unclassified Methylobacterium TaxID=2615210 RepID=UPI0011C9D405|nr:MULTISPECIES: hypothetical protein [unclassified Methylobacterium]TXM92980.1 hypothetical protein FV223_09895 [Methylobacterium sp. WL116]TXN32608.1 hypothetical protein FV225_19635 [Methylobacterium sp. WL93]TXN49604.1 hypothetical protein FV227_15765 [Methylobacterium sp. WL119]TXN67168.1 hypothetical protein FV232_12975 [Methylobacterium sp. WL30]